MDSKIKYSLGFMLSGEMGWTPVAGRDALRLIPIGK